MTDKYTEERTCVITQPMIEQVLEAFKSGTLFCVSLTDWESEHITNYRFNGRLYNVGNLMYIKVTNDERRRLLPILKSLRTGKPNKK